KALAPLSNGDAVVERLAMALRERGYEVDLNVGQSKFRCDLAVRSKTDSLYQLGILVDTHGHYANPNLLDRYLMQPSILKAFGWRFALVLTKDWYHSPEDVLLRLEKLLRGLEVETESEPEEEAVTVEANSGAAPTTPVETARVASQPSPATGTPPAATSATPSAVRYFEFIGGASKKFWEISLSGNSFTVRFGRLGTAGQSQTKTFADKAKATREAESLIAEKVKKGYREKQSCGD
ncbi:MAG: WGR domain-containing protein, partial [Verrucomicrobiota bacterium]